MSGIKPGTVLAGLTAVKTEGEWSDEDEDTRKIR